MALRAWSIFGQLGLKGLNRNQAQLNSFDRAGQKTARTSMGLAGAAGAAGIAISVVGLAAVAAAVEGVRAFSEFDGAMTQSLAIMGDVSDMMRRDMSDAAREVATTTSFSATQAAESYFFLASAGFDAEQSMAALPAVANFAQAGMFDMARATDILTDAQSALGLSTDDVAQNLENMIRVSDALVAANTVANASVEQFGQALTNRAAARMRQFNIEVEEGLSVLAAFADQGIKGRRAGQQLEILLRDLASTAVNNEDAFETLGIRVFDTEGAFRGVADIVEDFENVLEGASVQQRTMAFEALNLNNRVASALTALLGTSDAIREYEDDITSAGNITERVANKQLQTFREQLGLMGSQLRDIFLQIGQEIVPGATDALTDFNEVLTKLQPTIRTLVGLIGVLADRTAWWVSTLVSVNEVLINKVFPVLFPTLNLQLRQLGATMDDSADEFEAAVGRMVVVARDEFEELDGMFRRLVMSGEVSAKELENIVHTLFGDFTPHGFEFIDTDQLRSVALALIPEASRDAFADMSREVASTIIQVQTLTGRAGEFVGVVGEGGEEVRKFSSALDEKLFRLREAQEDGLEFFSSLNSIASDHLALSRALRDSNLDTLKIAEDLVDIQLQYRDAVDSGQLSVGQLAQGLRRILDIKEELMEIIGLDEDDLGLVGDTDIDPIPIPAPTGEAVAHQVERNFVTPVRQTLGDKLGEIRPDLERMGTNIVRDLMRGTLSARDIVERAIGILVSRFIMPGLLDAFQIGSPSKWMMDRGRNLMEGLALGIERNAGLVSSAMNTATRPIMAATSATQADMARFSAAGSMNRSLALDVSGLPPAQNPFETARDHRWQEILRESIIHARNEGFKR